MQGSGGPALETRRGGGDGSVSCMALMVTRRAASCHTGHQYGGPNESHIFTPSPPLHNHGVLKLCLWVWRPRSLFSVVVFLLLAGALSQFADGFRSIHHVRENRFKGACESSLKAVSVPQGLKKKLCLFHRRRTMEGHAENVANGRDVTVILMPNSTIENQDCADDPSKKRKRILEDCTSEIPETGNGLAPLCEIHANSTRLRHCSKYFESLMSGRWTVQTQTGQSTSAMKFVLEVQTDIVYYRDCFSRMYMLHRPILSVRHCIELLKVASQIEYKELMDICLQCLSAIPWTAEEEEQIREFCMSGQYLASRSATDLNARLHLPLTKSDKQKERRTCVERSLKRYLASSLEHEGISEFYIREESREMFENAFLAIVTGVDIALIQFALTLGKDEARKLMCSVKGFCEDVTKFRPAYYLYRSIIDILDDVSNFRWLFLFLRKANAAQAVVEGLVMDHEVSDLFLEAGYTIYCSHKEFWVEWSEVQMNLTKMIIVTFEDILSGRLFMNSSDRMTLFHQWKWILQSTTDVFLSTAALPRTRSIATVIASFIRTFPLPEQEEVIRSWMRRDHDHRFERNFDYRDLTEAHTTWITNLITQVQASSAQMDTASLEGQTGPSDKEQAVVFAQNVRTGPESSSTADHEASGSENMARPCPADDKDLPQAGAFDG